jgi:DNA-binding SARP family transcriptional activator
VAALGPLEIALDGKPIPAAAWSNATARELLLYLLCHPAGRTREQIGHALWRDASPAQIKSNLHVALLELRRALGRPDWIVFEEERYRLNPRFAVEFDARRFEAEVRTARVALTRSGDPAPLERALERYKGDFLGAGASGLGAGEWQVEFRERWRRLYDEGRGVLQEHARPREVP